MIEVPSFAEVIVIHELTLTTFGGLPGVTEQGFGKLDAALNAPQQSMFGEDLYPDLVTKATALFFGLIRAHAFSDGNKRVALVALLDMLGRNGFCLAADDDAVYQFVLQAAHTGERAWAEAWITARMIAA